MTGAQFLLAVGFAVVVALGVFIWLVRRENRDIQEHRAYRLSKEGASLPRTDDWKSESEEAVRERLKVLDRL